MNSVVILMIMASSTVFLRVFNTLILFDLHPGFGQDFGFSSTVLSGVGFSLVAPLCPLGAPICFCSLTGFSSFTICLEDGTWGFS